VFQHYPPHRIQRRRGADGKEDRSDYYVGATLEQLELIAVICSKTRFGDERSLTAQEARQLEQVEALKSMDPAMTLRRAKVQYPTLMGQMDQGLTLNSGRSKMFQNLASVMLDDATRPVVGDASETALFNFVKMRNSIELLRYHHQKVYDVPFNSRNKYALTVSKPVGLAHESPDKRTLMMKGAPEVVLKRCTHFMRRGEVLPIDARFTVEFQEAYERFGNLGQRVLGFASLDLPPEQFGAKFDDQYASNPDAVPTSGLVFVGLVSLVDPPKESVPQAVLDCHTAGIKVIMVTGDHPLTAAAIARQVNIFQQGLFTRQELATLKQCALEEVDEEEVDCVVVTGPELDAFTEVDWTRTLNKQNIVFARTTPQQKLFIVDHLQKMGHVVAATGDGVNDSPALKKADIGVAMGINGSDVARDAAAVILMVRAMAFNGVASACHWRAAFSRSSLIDCLCCLFCVSLSGRQFCFDRRWCARGSYDLRQSHQDHCLHLHALVARSDSRVAHTGV
jgi:magnesium-transporting ATPase (P-type)